MTDDHEARTAERAYRIWQDEGSPEGRHLEHWRQAQQDLLDEQGGDPGEGLGDGPVDQQGVASANLSVDHQQEGDAGLPRDTLDREPSRDPESGGTIPDDYNPETMTRVGEEAASPPVTQVDPKKRGKPAA